MGRSGSRVSSRILDRYLLDGERVVVATRQHWAKLLEPVATTLAGFLLVSWVSGSADAAFGPVTLGLWWIWFAVVARLVWRLLEWRNEWFVATDKRLLMTYGLITHKVAMMPLRKVTDMNYARSPVGRVLGYGQFLLESAGQDQAMRKIDWLPDPDNAYRRICDTIFGPGGRDVDEDGPDPGSDDLEYADRSGPRQGPGPGEDRQEQAEIDGEPGPEGSTEGRSWEVSTEEAAGYAPVSVQARPRRRPITVEDDPDATGPVPRPAREGE